MGDMTQAEMMDLISENRAEIAVLENEITVWKENYVRLNRKFQDGERALFHGKVGYVTKGFFSDGHSVMETEGINYIIKKMKKDGTQGVQNMTWRNLHENEISPVEPR